jgi:hypothetical protein
MLIHLMKFVKAFHLCHDGSLRCYKKELFFHAIVKRKALLLRMKTVLYL